MLAAYTDKKVTKWSNWRLSSISMKWSLFWFFTTLLWRCCERTTTQGWS